MNSIHWTKTGEGSPLVLLHGWGFDSAIWDPLLPFLQEKYTVYSVDLPGFGFTAWMTWEIFEALLLSLLPPHFAILGWSLGGLAAMRLALSHSARITHIYCIATSPYFLREPGWPGVKKTVLDTFYQQLLQNKDELLHKLGNMIQSYPANPSLEGLIWGLDCLKNWDLREALREWNKPICFMFGLIDPILPISIHRAMTKNYPKFQYIIFQQSGHIPFLTEPKKFLECLDTKL
jgi:pimeloyl-[acyl-carrier protein] methyl ester esterase